MSARWPQDNSYMRPVWPKTTPWWLEDEGGMSPSWPKRIHIRSTGILGIQLSQTSVIQPSPPYSNAWHEATEFCNRSSLCKNNARLHGNYYVIPTHWSLTRGWYLHDTPTKPTSDLKMTRAWKLDDSMYVFRWLINQFLIRPRWAQWWFKYEIKISPKWLQGAWRMRSRWAQYDPKLTQTWNWWPQARPRPRVV